VGPIGSPARPTYERVAGEVFEEERQLSSAAKVEWRVFDYLELDRRDLDVIDVVRSR
jgi:hypothetical protein